MALCASNFKETLKSQCVFSSPFKWPSRSLLMTIGLPLLLLSSVTGFLLFHLSVTTPWPSSEKCSGPPTCPQSSLKAARHWEWWVQSLGGGHTCTVCTMYFFFILICFYVFIMPCGMGDLCSLTRVRTHGPCIGCVESEPLDCLESPCTTYFLSITKMCFKF